MNTIRIRKQKPDKNNPRVMESVRAVILENNAVLLLHRRKPHAEYWVVPGGRVEAGEERISALARECKEELGVAIKIGKELCSFSSRYPDGVRTQHVFLCSIVSGVVGTGEGPEYQVDGGYSGTYTPEWVPLGHLPTLPLKPSLLKRFLLRILSEHSVVGAIL